MSRSRNEVSIPLQRGRKGKLRGKRLSHKRVRRLPINTDNIVLKRTTRSVILDKDPKIY